MGWYAAALVAGGLVGRVGVALASARRRLARSDRLRSPSSRSRQRSRCAVRCPREVCRGGAVRTARGLLNPRLLAVAVAGAALFFTFVGTFTFVPYRLEQAPFELGTSAASLVFLLWVVGLASPVAGRIAESIGWRRLTLVAARTRRLRSRDTLPEPAAR